MYAIYWHFRDKNGNIGIQGHYATDTHEEAVHVMKNQLERIQPDNLVSWDVFIVTPSGLIEPYHAYRKEASK